jgi:hypothetical protein
LDHLKVGLVFHLTYPLGAINTAATGKLTAAFIVDTLVGVGEGGITTGVAGMLVGVGEGATSVGVAGMLVGVGEGATSVGVTGMLSGVGEGETSVGLTGLLSGVGEGRISVDTGCSGVEEAGMRVGVSCTPGVSVTSSPVTGIGGGNIVINTLLSEDNRSRNNSTIDFQYRPVNI